jgi:nitrogen fixation/metabolism regulation signal transduction histidine kinase
MSPGYTVTEFKWPAEGGGMVHKRKKLNLSVKREFQLWLLIRIIGTILFSSLVAAAVLFFYARQEIGDSFYEAHIRIRHVSDLLIPVVIAGSLVSLISGTILALFLPQKIAGPIFRIEEDLKKIRDGQLDKVIKIRQGDPLQDFADTINNTMAALRGAREDKEK